MNNPSQPGRRRSCWFYGCLSLVVLSLVGLCLAFLVFFWAARSLDQAVQRYTDTQPTPIEQVQLPPAELTNLRQRLDSFAETLETPRKGAELVLDAQEINALISQDPRYRELAGKLHLAIDGNRVKCRLSLPLSDLGFSSLKGRYLNGIATFRISLQKGQLSLEVQDLQANGQPLPKWIVDRLQDQALGQQIEHNPDIKKVIDQFDTISVQDGQLLLRSKGQM